MTSHSIPLCMSTCLPAPLSLPFFQLLYATITAPLSVRAPCYSRALHRIAIITLLTLSSYLFCLCISIARCICVLLSGFVLPCLSLSLSASFPVCLLLFQSPFLSLCPYVWSVCMWFYSNSRGSLTLSSDQFIYSQFSSLLLSVCVCVFLFVCPSFCLSANLSPYVSESFSLHPCLSSLISFFLDHCSAVLRFPPSSYSRAAFKISYLYYCSALRSLLRHLLSISSRQTLFKVSSTDGQPEATETISSTR